PSTMLRMVPLPVPGRGFRSLPAQRRPWFVAYWRGAVGAAAGVVAAAGMGAAGIVAGVALQLLEADVSFRFLAHGALDRGHELGGDRVGDLESRLVRCDAD